MRNEIVAEIRTESGSLYWVRRSPDGKWWLRAANVVTEQSKAVEGEWEILEPSPWPPQEGTQMLFVFPKLVEEAKTRGEPIAKGAGKITSPVVVARNITGS